MKRSAILYLVVALSSTSALALPDLRQESARIVSQHKAVFAALPKGENGFSTDAVLLGNGDIAMSVSATPLAKDSGLKKQEPGKIRFWFNKNDLWELGGQTKARLFAVLDASFQFDPAKPEPKCRVETDLYTATTFGTLSQEGGVTVRFKAWVSAVENMIFLEFVAENGKAPCAFDMQVMQDRSEWEKRELPGDAGLYLSRTFTKGSPPTGVSMCMRRLGSGRHNELDSNRQVFAFALDSLMKNPKYADDVVKKMAAFDPGSLAARHEAHKRWWADFWAESWVEIPDKAIERQYYLSQYILASCCRDKDFPPGILSTWICTDNPGWANDYHLNYNFQAAFYGLYGANHVALGEVQDQPLLDYMPTGRELARKRLDMPGILYPVGIGPKGTTTWGNDYGQKSNASYGAVNMIFRWKTTYDPAYARKVYPYFKELTTFWEAYLVFEKENNRYVIAHDSVHEGSGKDFNSIVSLALCRAVFGTALEMSDALGVDRNKRETWNNILTHLSKYATREVDGKTIFRYTERGTEYWDGNTLGIQHIYPALGIGLESDPELIQIALNTIDYMQRWFDNNGDNSFFPAAAYLGYKPDAIYARLNEYVTKHYRPNGLRQNKHGIEKVSTIPNTVDMMLCSVHRDVMRLFPAWPKTVDARFANLRQFGAFLVASEWKNGQVRFVKVASEKGRDLTLVNPWPGRQVAVQRDQGKAEAVTGPRFTLKTKPGETLTLTPAGS